MSELVRIVDRYKEDVDKFIDNGNMSYLLYVMLFGYYCAMHLIPYDIASGKEGDAREWVETRFKEYMVKYHAADRMLNRPGLFD